MASKEERNCVEWNTLLVKAVKQKIESEATLNKAVQSLMKYKGFATNVAELFACDFAGANETVIKFNGQGEFADLDLRFASKMTKEEILKRLRNELSEENIKLIEGKMVEE